MNKELTEVDWIQTYTGKVFPIFNPKPDDIDIRDIAHALSNLCRFGGHCKVYYSVAQHSIEAAKEMMIRYPPIQPIHRYGLLHDAAEAYLVDLPHPIKRRIDLYQEVEAKLMESISTRFDMKYPPDIAMSYRERMIDVDNVLLATERNAIMEKCPRKWKSLDGVKTIERWLGPWLLPQEAEQKFLEFALILGVE